MIACGGGDGGFGGKMEHEGDDSQVNKISEEFNSALHDNFSGDETKTKVFFYFFTKYNFIFTK